MVTYLPIFIPSFHFGQAFHLDTGLSIRSGGQALVENSCNELVGWFRSWFVDFSYHISFLD
jgi:hypothetical protein